MKICKFCGTKYKDAESKCPGCHSTEFYTVMDDEEPEGKTRKGDKAKGFFTAFKKAPGIIKATVILGALVILLLAYLNIAQLLKPRPTIPAMDDPDTITTSHNSELKVQPLDFGFEDIGELATQSAYYTEILSDENYKKFFKTDINVPGTKSRYIVSFDGIIKAGIDFSEISYRTDDERKIVYIKLPEAKIISNELDYNSLTVWDEKLNILNPKTFEQTNDAYATIASNAQEKALSNGILENAIDNAKILVEASCKAVLPNHEVIFE